MKKKYLVGLAAGLFMFGMANTVSADDFDFSGTFVVDNDILQFNFNVDSQRASCKTPFETTNLRN